MIARELTEFFAGFSPDGRPRVQRAGDPSFLSNVNACYARGCWEEIRFRDVAYSEDQAFGADMLAAGWSKVYHPGAAVLHAHDYGALEFMRRYFDEYRGLRESTGHVEPFALARLGPSSRPRRGRRPALDGRARARRRTSRRAGPRAPPSITAAGACSRPLGSRADRLPVPVRGRLSLEGRDDRRRRSGRPRTPRRASHRFRPATHMPPKRDHDDYEDVARFWREGSAPLLDPVPGMAERERLRLALVIPSFRRGSGGHNTLLQIFSRLERRGHLCSVWLYDFTGHAQRRVARRSSAPTSASSSPRSKAPCTRASTTGRAPTWRSRPAGRPCTRR